MSINKMQGDSAIVPSSYRKMLISITRLETQQRLDYLGITAVNWQASIENQKCPVLEGLNMEHLKEYRIII